MAVGKDHLAYLATGCDATISGLTGTGTFVIPTEDADKHYAEVDAEATCECTSACGVERRARTAVAG